MRKRRFKQRRSAPRGPVRASAPAGGRVISMAADVTIQAAGGAKGQKPTFRLTAYTGGAMVVPWWDHPVVIDLQGLDISSQRRPVLKDHSTSMVVGHTESIDIDGASLTVEGIVSGAGNIAREVVEAAINGFPWQVSVGVSPNNVEFVNDGAKGDANGSTHDGPVYIIRASQLKEVSFVVLGADERTKAQIAASRANKKETAMEFERWIKAMGFDPDALTDEQRSGLCAAFEAASAHEGGELENDGGDEPAPAPENIPDPVTAMRVRAASEQRRQNEIHAACSVNGRTYGDIAARAIAENWSIDKTRLEVIQASRPVVGHPRQVDDRRAFAAIEASLCVSAGIPEDRVASEYGDQVMSIANSRDIRGAGIHTLIHECVRVNGGYIPTGRIDDSSIRAALEADASAIRAADGGFSTISLSGILSNIANKVMLTAYRSQPSAAAQIASSRPVNDFKQVSSYRLTGRGEFEVVGPDGELKHGNLGEDGYTNQVQTWGRMFSLTRQMMVNDDLGAFLQIPTIIGRMSFLARERAFFSVLLGGVGSFFSVSNNNYDSGADTALGVDSLTEAEVLFMNQVDSDGKPIVVMPKTLLVPTTLYTPARRLMGSLSLNNGSEVDTPAMNPHAGKWGVVTSPFLNAQAVPGSSDVHWLLFGDPTDISAIEIAYLRGRNQPIIERGDTSFNTLGVQFRGYFDFGVGLQDPRGAVYMKGEN